MAGKSAIEVAREVKDELVVVRSQVDTLRGELDDAQLFTLRERVVTLETEVRELKRVREEADRRHWQFAFVAAGVLGTLVVQVVVQLVLAAVRKP